MNVRFWDDTNLSFFFSDIFFVLMLESGFGALFYQVVMRNSSDDGHFSYSIFLVFFLAMKNEEMGSRRILDITLGQ